MSIINQPKPFYLIFLMEIWERFGYYGVLSLLVLFMVKQLGVSDELADHVCAAFVALVYLLPVLGGYVGDNLLGTKRTMVFGAMVLAIGYGLLSFQSTQHSIYLALAIIAVGNGLFKANPASLLSKVYVNAGLNADSGFTLYYMAINIGSFFSILITPFISQRYGWWAGFLTCCAGLLITLLGYGLLRNLVKDCGSPADFQPLNYSKLLATLAVVIIIVIISAQLLQSPALMVILLALGMLGFAAFYVYQLIQASPKERIGMYMFIVLFFQAVIFFVLYLQMPTSLNLYALRNITHTLFGIHIHPASFQALNPFWIILLSPVMAFVYQGLSNRNRDISTPAKFALGTLLAGVSFLILPIGGLFADHGIVNNGWLIVSYFFQAIGELLVSALGLAMVSRYIPQRLTGFAMGLWLMCTAVAGMLAGLVAARANVPHDITDPMLSLPIYNHLFLQIGITTVCISGIMFLFILAVHRSLQKIH